VKSKKNQLPPNQLPLALACGIKKKSIATKSIATGFSLWNQNQLPLALEII
jgi:hypothetical protein